MRAAGIVALALVAALTAAPRAAADGGVTAASRAAGDARTTAFVAPMAPRVGVIDVSVLLTPQPPRWERVELRVRAVHVESGIERSEPARPAHQGNRLLRSALLDLPRPGRWRIEVTFDGPFDATLEGATAGHAADGAAANPLAAVWPPLDFLIDVAPEPPPWRTQWPWLFAWLPLTAMLLWRDRLVAVRGAVRGE